MHCILLTGQAGSHPTSILLFCLADADLVKQLGTKSFMKFHNRPQPIMRFHHGSQTEFEEAGMLFARYLRRSRFKPIMSKSAFPPCNRLQGANTPDVTLPLPPSACAIVLLTPCETLAPVPSAQHTSNEQSCMCCDVYITVAVCGLQRQLHLNTIVAYGMLYSMRGLQMQVHLNTYLHGLSSHFATWGLQRQILGGYQSHMRAPVPFSHAESAWPAHQ